MHTNEIWFLKNRQEVMRGRYGNYNVAQVAQTVAENWDNITEGGRANVTVLARNPQNPNVIHIIANGRMI